MRWNSTARCAKSCAPSSKTWSAPRPRSRWKKNSASPSPPRRKSNSAKSSGRFLVTTNSRTSFVSWPAGRRPKAPAAEQTQPGSEKCIALIYEGVSAVTKIRDVLGPTDPSKAPPGSIRREFGQNIMVNAAHASDSTESATRELGIVKPAENNFRRVVEQFCGGV
ncbi:MAG: nucleoside-diphosphate kinase [Verrucomicrobiota bacterium]